MKLDSGELTIKTPTQSQVAGLMPTMTYTEVLSCCYGDRTIGYTRYYTALQNNMKIDLFVRIPQAFNISTKCRVWISPYSHTDTSVYKIISITQVVDDDGLPYTDLTLERLEEEGAN